MVRPEPLAMTKTQREVFLAWLAEQEIEPGEICNDGRFSVTGVRLTGNKFVTGQDGNHIVYKGRKVVVPFIWPQKTPYPEDLL